MYLTNCSAWSLCSVDFITAMLMPATWLATGSAAPAGAGKGTTPYSLDFMPFDSMVASALFWLMIIAAFLLAKADTDLTPLSYWLSEGLTTLSVCIRSRERLMPLTMPSVVKVGLPSASNSSAPFWEALMKAKWLFSVYEPAARDMP